MKPFAWSLTLSVWSFFWTKKKVCKTAFQIIDSIIDSERLTADVENFLDKICYWPPPMWFRAVIWPFCHFPFLLPPPFSDQISTVRVWNQLLLWRDCFVSPSKALAPGNLRTDRLLSAKSLNVYAEYRSPVAKCIWAIPLSILYFSIGHAWKPWSWKISDADALWSQILLTSGDRALSPLVITLPGYECLFFWIIRLRCRVDGEKVSFLPDVGLTNKNRRHEQIWSKWSTVNIFIFYFRLFLSFTTQTILFFISSPSRFSPSSPSSYPYSYSYPPPSPSSNEPFRN